MLRFKLSDSPPPRSCLVGYYHGTRFDPETNVGFDDRSWEWEQNRTGYEQVVKVHRYGTPADAVGSADVVVGNVSARRRDLIDPVPLPWGNRLGAETRFRRELLVYNVLADPFDPTTSAAAEQAVVELKRSIQIVDVDGTPANDVVWDIGLVPDPGVPDDGRVDISGTGIYGWRVFLYVDRMTSKERPLIVRYNAIETALSSGNPVIRYGHEELLRPAPYLNGGVIEPGAAVPGTDDYALEIHDDASFRMMTGGVVNPCMAIALWTDLPDRGWEVEVVGLDRDLVLYDTSPGPGLEVEIGRVATITQRSVKEVVQEVNKLNLQIKATALIDYPSAELQVAGINPITAIGSDALLMESHFFVYYFNESKMYMEPPQDLERSEDWFPVVVGSPVRHLINDPGNPLHLYEATYNLGEQAWAPKSQLFNIANGYDKDYLESINEPAEFVSGEFIALRHRDFLPESLRLMVAGKDMTDAIIDYDETAGVLWLRRNIIDGDIYTTHYAYDPKWRVVVDFLNLNTTQLHLPDGYRLYFGVYVMPSRLAAPGGAISTFAPNIGYVVANTVAEIEAAIQNLVDSSTGLPTAARLLGVFQVSSQGESQHVKILDIRTGGGGLSEDVDLKEVFKRAPEAQFFADIGYWEGEPYAGSGVIVVKAPQRIIGDDDSPVDAPADGGFVDTTGREDPGDIKRRVDKHLTIGMTGVLDVESS